MSLRNEKHLAIVMALALVCLIVWLIETDAGYGVAHTPVLLAPAAAPAKLP